MNPVEIDQLAVQVDQLMRTVESLQFENAALRQKIAVSIQERTRLIYKNQRASKQIRQIIKQMKEEIS